MILTMGYVLHILSCHIFLGFCRKDGLFHIGFSEALVFLFLQVVKYWWRASFQSAIWWKFEKVNTVIPYFCQPFEAVDLEAIGTGGSLYYGVGTATDYMSLNNWLSHSLDVHFKFLVCIHKIWMYPAYICDYSCLIAMLYLSPVIVRRARIITDKPDVNTLNPQRAAHSLQSTVIKAFSWQQTHVFVLVI